MDPLLIAVIALLVALLVVQFRRPIGRIEGGPAPIDLGAQVVAATQSALSEALGRLSEQSARDRNEALRMATDLVTKASGEALGARAQVIDATMQGVKNDVTDRLKDLSDALKGLEVTSSAQYSTMDSAIATLSRRTENLNEVLSSSQKRGQWGERLAEDILRSAGFVEGKNYAKQKQIEGGGKPDFRFDMPPDRILFMDVKFPLDQYMAFLASTDEAVRVNSKEAFLRALRGHVDALAKREYVDRAIENTIDYVLMFVPNESISSFIHEADPTLIDAALNKKVVLCTPLTLYAFLVVIRQAADSFHTERTAAEIMKRINLFDTEWNNYTKAVDAVEVSFKKTLDSIESINTGGTRFRKLSVQVREIEKIRKQQGIPESVDGVLIEDPLELEAIEE